MKIETQEYPEWFRKCLKTYEFGSESRGNQYLASISEYPYVREGGVTHILKLIVGSDQPIVLDVLGGDGYIAQIAKHIGINAKIITNDISLFMASNSANNGNATTLQPADNLFLLNDNCVDTVIMAYGTHHVPVEKRHAAFKEAYRVLKKGGRLILHDFANGSNMEKFFKEVVDAYSLTEHKHEHFNIEKTIDMLKEARFNTSHHTMNDDFVFKNASKKEVLLKCARYFYLMYALDKMGDIDSQDTRDELLEKIKDILGMECSHKDKLYECRVFRKSIIFIGDKQ